MRDEKKRLAALTRSARVLLRQAQELRREVDFLDRFSAQLPASACAAARSYLTMIEHGAELTLAQFDQFASELARQEADKKVKRLAAKLGVSDKARSG